jgi:hypothetical protein
MTEEENKGITEAPPDGDNADVDVDTNSGSAGEAGGAERVSGDSTGMSPLDNPPSDGDKGVSGVNDKSYEALRVKMNEQGIEINTLRRQLEEAQSKAQSAEEGTSKVQEVSEELAAYKKWYDQYYPVLNDLWQDESIRARIEAGVKPPVMTEQDAEKIADRKIQEYKKRTDSERSIDAWINKHPDVKGKLAKDIHGYLEKHDLDPTPEILEMAYVYCTKDKIKEMGAKEKEAHQKKVSNAMVGGGSTASAGKPKNPVDDLFAEPISNYYPGAKFL